MWANDIKTHTFIKGSIFLPLSHTLITLKWNSNLLYFLQNSHASLLHTFWNPNPLYSLKNYHASLLYTILSLLFHNLGNWTFCSFEYHHCTSILFGSFDLAHIFEFWNDNDDKFVRIYRLWNIESFIVLIYYFFFSYVWSQKMKIRNN